MVLADAVRAEASRRDPSASSCPGSIAFAFFAELKAAAERQGVSAAHARPQRPFEPILGALLDDSWARLRLGAQGAAGVS